jgi:hypothetical protein
VFPDDSRSITNASGNTAGERGTSYIVDLDRVQHPTRSRQ